MQPLTAPAPRAPFRRPINRRRDSLESFPALGRRNADAARRALRPEDAAERATVCHRRDPHPRPRHWPRDGGVHGGRRAAPAPTPRPRSRPPCCVVGTAARPRIRLFVGARRRPRVRAAHPIARASRVLRLLWRLAAAHSGTRPDLAAAPRPRVGRLLRRARLAPGATAADARAELTAFFGRAEASPWQRDLRGVVHTLPRLVLGDVRPALFAFAAAAALLLLITCINIANLLLVRSVGRAREIAVRTALGAGRGQVVVQLVIENGLLAVAGGALGVALAAAAARAFVAFAPAGLPRLDEIHLNATALAGAIVITGVAVLLFGLAPAVLGSSVEPQQALRSDARQSGSRRSRLATEGLVMGQVALALVVLSAAGLVARTLIELERAELSLEASHLLIGELAIRSDQYDDAAKQRALLERMLPQLRAIPGVRGVSPVVAVPFAGAAAWDGRPAAEGQSSEEAAANPMLNMDVVTPDYFKTLGIPVLRGRGFPDADRAGAPLVVVVSQSAARHYWGTDDPIGRRLWNGADLKRAVTVVGVVPDTRYRDLREARPSIYFPLAQSFFPFAPLALAVRTSGPPAELVPTIRRVIAETEPGVALASAAPFGTFLEGPLAQPRLNALLLAVFAGAAVTLAAVGLFGAMAAMVRQRRRELGVRMALGATAGDLRGMVMRRGLTIAAVGSVLGVFGALLANRLLVTLLYDVTPTDLATLTVVTGLLIGVAALASLVPAQSSARVDPMVALRTE